jgi:hypothetical protein
MKNKLINSTIEVINSAIFKYSKKFLYTSLRDLDFTMRSYIDLIVNGNLNALKKIHVPISKAVLKATLDTIQIEYAELSNNKEVSAYVKRNDKLGILIRKHEILRSCGVVLSVFPDNKEVLEFLNKSNIKGGDVLKRLESECKALELKIAELQTLNKVENKSENKSEKKATIEDYITVFIRMNEVVVGLQANMDMPVLTYIQAMARYRKIVEDNNKQVEKLKRRK